MEEKSERGKPRIMMLDDIKAVDPWIHGRPNTSKYRIKTNFCGSISFESPINIKVKLIY